MLSYRRHTSERVPVLQLCGTKLAWHSEEVNDTDLNSLQTWTSTLSWSRGLSCLAWHAQSDCMYLPNVAYCRGCSTTRDLGLGIVNMNVRLC